MKLQDLFIGLLVISMATAYDINLSGSAYLKLFTDYQDSVSNTYRYITHAVRNLSQLDERFYDEISSVCGTGLWLLYNENNFANHEKIHYGYHIAMVDGCSELYPEMDNKVRSVRFAGDTWTLNRPVVNLYEDVNFAGLEYLSHVNMSDVKATFSDTKSVIVTGTSSWTIYEEAGYTGSCVCMTPSHHVSSGDVSLDYVTAKSLRISGVGSIREGCDTRASSHLSAASSSGFDGVYPGNSANLETPGF